MTLNIQRPIFAVGDVVFMVSGRQVLGSAIKGIRASQEEVIYLTEYGEYSEKRLFSNYFVAICEAEKD